MHKPSRQDKVPNIHSVSCILQVAGRTSVLNCYHTMIAMRGSSCNKAAAAGGREDDYGQLTETVISGMLLTWHWSISL
jgi:hypothetical protein